ncbi:MAG: WcaF family extracellular polysaccharide biosynthesis acetyltransferase [Bacteroidia bacterium]|nr:WcaF family extracellular polysaccharide biosynthesis acetyltransferase [Bacteroidia bacterium]
MQQNFKTTDLSQYTNKEYNPGNIIKRMLWYMIGECLVNSAIPGSCWRVMLLRIFGAKIGKGVVIKPFVKIKYPWLLQIGDYTWIGEQVWIDNLAKVKIGSNACISQGAMLLCGNHNYKKTTFDLIVRGITIEDGAWVGAKSVVCPGVVVKSHSIITVGSVIINNSEPYSIYQGNPAVKIRDRIIE